MVILALKIVVNYKFQNSEDFLLQNAKDLFSNLKSLITIHVGELIFVKWLR